MSQSRVGCLGASGSEMSVKSLCRVPIQRPVVCIVVSTHHWQLGTFWLHAPRQYASLFQARRC